ncbi:MAG: hypothetical protein H7A23_05365 [Leptospiraceae bacterium]|nr:hypothetical protein [Leptospiraceae bacterium]MCP5493965.1 hypothetical protein [Leptospiraceae bacterium]
MYKNFFLFLYLFIFTGVLFSQEGELDEPNAKYLEALKKEKKYHLTLNQSFSNDIWFRGSSVLGERLTMRNNTPYQTLYQSWNIVTGFSYETPIEGLAISMNVYSPTAHRSNIDNDHLMQSAPGDSTDYTSQFVNSMMGQGYTSDPLCPGVAAANQSFCSAALKNGVDPTSIKFRKDKNGLKDIWDTSIGYNWKSKIGIITTGFYFANNNNYFTGSNVPIMLGELVVGVKFPFLAKYNIAYTAYYRFTSEAGGGGNGGSNHRISFSRTFLEKKFINFTISSSAGYQHITNQVMGVSDISPKIQVNFGSIYVSFMDAIRPYSRLYDNSTQGVYTNSNVADGRVDDPSKVHGIKNQFIVEQIQSGVDNLQTNGTIADSTGYTREVLKLKLVQNYQQQKFVKNLFFATIGYSKKF